MKKLWMVLAILITFAACTSAQVSSPFTLYAGGAITFPTSEGFSDLYKNGLHGTIGVGYKMAPKFQVIGKVEYHTFKFNFDNSDVSSIMSGWSGGTNKMWMFGVDGKLSLSLPAAPIAPYFLGGVGIANIKQSEFEGPVSLNLSLFNQLIAESQNKLYFNLGVGTELGSGPAFSFFAQARWVSIQTDGETTNFVPVTVGLRFF